MLDTVRTGNFEVVRQSWTGDYNEASTFLNTLETNDSNNNGKFSHAQYDALLKKALTAKDKQEKEAIYQQASDILDSNVPLLPIYYYVQPQMVKTYIGGFSPNVRGDYYTQDMYILKH